MTKRPIATRYLRELPNTWVFGVLWMAALLSMAALAARG